MINYVVGFLFSPDLKNVLLIQKNRPEWQKGKYNGIGGKIESGETPLKAMIREFKEETGLEITNWSSLCQMYKEGHFVYFFYAVSENWLRFSSETDEEVFGIQVDSLYSERNYLIQNLNWLIPLAIDIETKFSGTIITN